jgi:diacylglycerol kinase family enzyme
LHVILFHNPRAGDEQHSRETVERLIREHGHSLEYYSTKEDGWELGLARPGDLVAIAGGDGTVGKVLTELVTKEPRPVALLPLGSANNIAQTLGLADRGLEELVRRWPVAGRRPYRLGQLVTAGTRAIFAETVGGGLFAESLRRSEETDGADDKIEHGLRLLRRIVDELPALEWRVDLDGSDRSGRFLAVEAMAIGWTGPGVPLAPAADPQDSLLDVVRICERDRTALASYLDARLHKRAVPSLPLNVLRCTRAILQPPHAAAVRIDDELLGADGEALSVSVAGRPVEVLS